MYRFDGSTVLIIKTDVTHTVTHQTTHILPPAGTQNALDESHKKASAQQAARSITLLARCRRAHGARLGRWRSQKHRQWPSAGVSGGGRDLTLRADDPTSRGTTQPNQNPTQHQTTPLKARFSSWALVLPSLSLPWAVAPAHHIHARQTKRDTRTTTQTTLTLPWNRTLYQRNERPVALVPN